MYTSSLSIDARIGRLSLHRELVRDLVGGPPGAVHGYGEADNAFANILLAKSPARDQG